jgi:hypothetical protein
LILLIFIVALFVKKEYEVEKSIIINKPKVEVFDYIKSLKNQNNYSKWSLMDPNMKKTYRGTDGQVGFVYAWESKNENLGVGEQEIKKIKEGELVEFELRFIKPFEATEKAYISTIAIDSNSNQTRTVWGFKGHMNYPMNIMLLFMNFEKMIGDDLQAGLENLKRVMEK